MECKLCKSQNLIVTYNGHIRNGSFGNLTQKEYNVYKCKDCGVIWHENSECDYEKYYESEVYRMTLEKESNIENYYSLHDKETLEKLTFTGTDIFRNKLVADIGCGGGSFLDFVQGVAKQTIAIEPSKIYRKTLEERHHITYAYSSNALNDFAGEIDVITSFDVIEHVNNPFTFVDEVYKLLKPSGKIILGTPSDHPVLRELLNTEFEQFIFSFQHPWVFSESSLFLIFNKMGFKNICVEQKQKYGIGNMISWLMNHKPNGHVKYDFISETSNDLWKREIENKKLGDYLVVYAQK